jgi:hypothetical protein
MESTALLHPSPRYGHRPIQMVLVRANAPLFYSVAAASLLEAVAPLYGQRLLHYVRGDRVMCDWVQNSWLPRKAARAKALQEYVEQTWPEFDWSGAYEQYRACVEAEGGLGPRRASLARELLARCVTAAQCGVFYGCLGRWADDPRLRKLAGTIAHDEAQSFRRFRVAHERGARLERFGFASAWRTAIGCVRIARDTHLPLVFRAISAQCNSHMPFPVLRQGEFVKRMRAVIERTCELGAAERLLFNPWKKRRRMVRIEEKQHRPPEWFKPLFREAA